jgi:hypothetical protein
MAKTEKEVEEEFAKLAAERKAATKINVTMPTKQDSKKKLPDYDSLETDLNEDAAGFGREKS